MSHYFLISLASAFIVPFRMPEYKVVLDKKKYIIVEQKDFEKLQLQAAQKTQPIKKLSLLQGKNHAYKLIDEWAKGK